jgi:prepilin peptidase CpaA
VHLLIPPPFHPAIAALLLAVALAAAVFDIRSRRIPNALCLAGLAAGIAVNVFLSGWSGLGRAGAGCLVAFGVYFVLYLAHAMGAGDVKLMAALGSIAGLEDWLRITALTWMVGAVFALVLAAWRGRLRTTIWNVAYITQEWLSRRAPYMRREELDVRSEKALCMPHGVSIAVGTLLVVFLSLWQPAW